MRDDASWMQTYSGGKFWPVDPRPEDVHLVDIAHALSHVCRFSGHCQEFYSVAQHSVLVSRLLDGTEHALWGLLHDAAEAFTSDVPRPVKRHLVGLPAIELKVLEAVAARFSLEPPPLSPQVWYADNTLLATEARDLFATPPVDGWNLKLGVSPLPTIIEPLEPKAAARAFLRRAAELGVGVM